MAMAFRLGGQDSGCVKIWAPFDRNPWMMIVWDFGLLLGNVGYQNGAIARWDGVPANEVAGLDGSPMG